MEGLAAACRFALGYPLAPMLARTERIVHGTTVATNALLERKGARVGLLTTEGHIDVLEMREGLKDDRYNLRMAPPEPLVPRDRRLGVEGADSRRWSHRRTLSNASLSQAIQELKRHEGQLGRRLLLAQLSRPDARAHDGCGSARSAMPDALCLAFLRCLAADQRVRAHLHDRGERLCRASTGSLPGRLETRLREAGFQGPLLVIQSHGGVATVSDAIRLAAGAVLSGPAGGVAGGRHAARLIGHEDLIPFDMGGTSTDISLIIGGEAAISSDRRLAGHRVGLQSLDIVSIGAGGGSIAGWMLAASCTSALKARARIPGPACYGRGGTAATVTDANLVLGYLDAATSSAAGPASMRPRPRPPWTGSPHRLGVDRMTAAEGIHRVVNTRMAEGMRLVSVRRGIDPTALRAALLRRRGWPAHHRHRPSA